jgi:hypothetical protein
MSPNSCTVAARWSSAKTGLWTRCRWPAPGLAARVATSESPLPGVAAVRPTLVAGAGVVVRAAVAIGAVLAEHLVHHLVDAVVDVLLNMLGELLHHLVERVLDQALRLQVLAVEARAVTEAGRGLHLGHLDVGVGGAWPLRAQASGCRQVVVLGHRVLLP